jgi:hemerythrin HHE cation binding domain-containing protein
MEDEMGEEARTRSRLETLFAEHADGLVVARELCEATDESAPAAAARFLAYWDVRGRAHLRLEEEILLPAYAASADPHHPLIARVLCDHVVIRSAAAQLMDSVSPASARALGACLTEHVTLEERELFPLIERSLSVSALDDVLSDLEGAERLLARD